MGRQKNVLKKALHDGVNVFHINIDFCGKVKNENRFQHRIFQEECTG